VRDFTRARTDLVHERTRVLQRLEKLLEDAMVKITSVVSDGMKAKSAVAMVAALVAGERDPRVIADLAKGSLRGKRDALAEALDGMFDSHHGVIAQALLDQVAFLDQRITQMEAGAIAALAQVEESWGVDADVETGPGRGTGPDSRVLAAVYRLAEIPGVSVWLAIVIIAEIGLNMALFPTPAHLVSWMGLCRSAAQSGTRRGKGKPKKGNSYARAAAGQAAIGAAGTATFLGERYARIARRRGGAIDQVAVARLDEITGIGVHTAQVLIAELGLDMRQFPTPGQLVSWAKLSPRTIQSGARNRSGKTGKGNRYLRGALGEAATAAAKTNTFLGERYRRLVKRRGKLKALVAISRSILVIVWHLLADPAAHYRDLGSDFYAKRIDKNRRQRHLIRQLEALGYTVTLEALPMAA